MQQDEEAGAVMTATPAFDPERLRAARGGLSQEEAAALCGIGVDTYRSYETGRRIPGTVNLAMLALGLNVAMEDLVTMGGPECP